MPHERAGTPPADEPVPGEVTRLLAQLTRGGRHAVDSLVPLVYDELERIAHRRLRGERANHTLDTSSLVHEAYLKLAGLERMEWQNRSHFFAIAASAMRRVLVDHAVRRNAQKRGGGREQVPLEQITLATDEDAEELLALDAALSRLDSINPRHARIVELRFFSGMSIPETAEALGVSPATVKREWTVARAWLHRELGR